MRVLLRITENTRFAMIIGSFRNLTALSRQVRMANSGFRIYAMAYSARMRFFVLAYLVAAVTSLHAQTPFDFASTVRLSTRFGLNPISKSLRFLAARL